MTTISARRFLTAGAVLAATALVFSAQAQTPPDPLAPAGIEVINISKNNAKQGSVFPQVAVSRSNPNLVAVAWRRYGLPIDTNALRENRVADCYISISKDGGKTFTERNMMDVLRTPGGNGQPLLWGCNAPWVAIAKDGTMYTGGAMFTAGGVVQAEPKAGRASVSTSTDGGVTWSKGVPGIMIDRFIPGMKGLAGGMNQEDTPWDGANGIVDPQTGTMYSNVGGYLSASDDKGKTFGTVYEGRGTASAAFGTVFAARTAQEFAGGKCPCLVGYVTSDKGKTWSESLIAQATAYSNQGTVRYPITGANPAKQGSYAVVAYQPDHMSIKVYYTADSGKTWKMSTPRPIPAGIGTASINQVGLGYTTDGRILVTWRGFRNPGAFNTFVAMMTGDTFGPTVKVNNEPSVYPPLIYLGNYNPTNGGGDFTTWVNGNNDYAFVASPYAPAGGALDTALFKVPLSLLK